MIQLFTAHPRSVGETYLEHLRFAGTFGIRMMTGGLACFVHGALPFLFQTTGSRTVLALHDRMTRVRAETVRRGAMPEPEYLI